MLAETKYRKSQHTSCLPKDLVEHEILLHIHSMCSYERRTVKSAFQFHID